VNLFRTDINGGPVSGQHVYLLHQKMTADDDDDSLSLMQYWWRCEINSSVAELILVAELAALQIAELLLVNSDSFDSVRQTDDSNFGHQSFSLPN